MLQDGKPKSLLFTSLSTPKTIITVNAHSEQQQPTRPELRRDGDFPRHVTAQTLCVYKYLHAIVFSNEHWLIRLYLSCFFSRQWLRHFISAFRNIFSLFLCTFTFGFLPRKNEGHRNILASLPIAEWRSFKLTDHRAIIIQHDVCLASSKNYLPPGHVIRYRP